MWESEGMLIVIFLKGIRAKWTQVHPANWTEHMDKMDEMVLDKISLPETLHLQKLRKPLFFGNIHSLSSDHNTLAFF